MYLHLLFVYYTIEYFILCVRLRVSMRERATCGLITVTSFSHKDSLRRARLAGSLFSGPCSAHWDGLLAGIERCCFQDGALGNWCSVSAGGQGSAGAVGRRCQCLFALAPSRLFGLPGSIAAVFPETGKENCRDFKACIWKHHIQLLVILLVKAVTKPAWVQGACGTGEGDR